MEFKNLTMARCPECGCDVVVAESVDTVRGRISEHVSGQRWEYRTFLCGQQVSWSPNFVDHIVSTTRVCRRSDSYKIMAEKRNYAKMDVNAFIESLDVDEEFKRNSKLG